MQRKRPGRGWRRAGAALAVLAGLAAGAAPVYDGAGNGFFITTNGYFVTCCRIIKNVPDPVIQQGGRQWPAKVAAFDVESDVALLKAEGAGPFPCLPIEDPQNLEPGAALATAGFPTLAITGNAPRFAQGKLKALTGPRDDPKFLQAEIAGSYGGPLLDARGNVVGIIGAAAGGLNYPVKSLYIDPLFDTLPEGRNTLAAKAEAPAAGKDLEARAVQALGLVLLPRAAAPAAVAAAGMEPGEGAQRTSGFKEPVFQYKYYEGGNLLRNGSFSNGLDGWRFKYDLDGESWYTNNHNHVSAITDEQTRQTMAKYTGGHAELLVPGMGVKMDSAPIPIKSTDRFKLSCWARSTGPDCRILVYGYKWKPGIKPHDNPTLPELRECYHSVQLYFTVPDLRNRKKGDTGFGAGDFGGVKKDWKQASVIFPDTKKWKATTTSDMNGKSISIGQEKWNSVEFLSIHMVAIGGKPGEMYVRDARIEKVQ